MNKIKVHLDKRQQNSYEIFIGQDILDRMGVILAKNPWGARYFIICDTNVAALYAEKVQHIFKKMDLRADLIEFPAGEASKNIATCGSIVERLAALGAERTSMLVALGGGVAGDITGFTASIYMRGMPYIQVPTTLLAQVDSSIGGKTGVDTAAGKNLLGTFHQPKAVFIDVAFLKTLPEKEFRNGLAEIVKYGMIESPDLLARLDEHWEEMKNRDGAFLQSIISKCCLIKKGIVEIDEKESGLRRILNFGHTIGHALEAESGYAISHGEAVSVGMAAAAVISERLQYLPRAETDRMLLLLAKMDLAHRLSRDLDIGGILARLRMDKKKQGDRVRFVLLKKMGIPFMNGVVPEPLVREALEGLRK